MEDGGLLTARLKDLTLDGEGEGVEGCCLNLGRWAAIPVVEFVGVAVEDGGGRGAVAVLGFAHEDGADFAEEAVGAVKEIDLGALDVDLDEVGRVGLFEEMVEGDAGDFEGLADASGLGVLDDRGEMVGGAVAVGDVKSACACCVGDCDLHDANGGCARGLCRCGALQQGCQPGIGFDGDDVAVGTCSLRGGDGEETDVGADVPDGVSRLHELTGEIEEIGFEAGVPVFETCIGRDIDQRRVEISGEVSQQDAVPAHLFY